MPFDFDFYDEEERKFFTEEIILGMADIVYENRRLKRELEEAKEYKQKYHDLIDQNFKDAQARTASLFEAIMAGAFSNGKENENNDIV